MGATSRAVGCRNAPPGFFTAIDGAKAPTKCPLGTAQPLEGQTSCKQARASGVWLAQR